MILFLECDDAEQSISLKKSLKLNLQSLLRNRFSVVHQEFGDCSLQDVYTELYVVKHCVGGLNRAHDISTIDMRQTGSSGDEQVKFTNMFTDQPATKVLTLGIAGVGKTVAVQKFVMDWAENNTNQYIDFVFVFRFRELNLKKGLHCNFLDLILLFYPDLEDLKNFAEFKECKILFVLDGLDESRLQLDFDNWITSLDKESSVGTLIASLIKDMLLPSSLIWVTTRPAAASLIPRECFNRVTEIRGFNESQKIDFFKKNIKNSEKANRVIDHITTNRSLRVMCYLSVFCHIIASVHVEMLEERSKQEPVETLTQMYTLYSVCQVKRMNDKYLKDKTMTAKEKGQFLVKLGKLAYRHLERGTLIFYEKDLKECDIDVTYGALQAGVCTQIFSVESAATGENLYSFVHLSVQEFLAAVYVMYENAVHWTRPLVKTWRETFSCLFKHSRFDLCKMAVDKALRSPNGHLDLFVRFLLGLTPMLEPTIQPPLTVILPQLAVRKESVNKVIQYIKVKIREDLLPERSINLFHCLNELGDRTLVEEINR